MAQVPAATKTLRVLRYLATQPAPVPLERIATACGLPRSSAYHLVNAMIAEGFVTHLPDEHRYGLGVAAFEVGSGFARQEPLQRLARRELTTLVDRVGRNAHLAVLHGRDVLYVVEERAPGRPPLVTDVGVRLPASLTASGRAILAGLPRSQVRALYPDRAAFVDRTGLGPDSPTRLREELAATRSRGYSLEVDEVTRGFSSVAAVVRNHNDHPEAAVAVTFPTAEADDVTRLARETVRAAGHVTRRLGGRPVTPVRLTR